AVAQAAGAGRARLHSRHRVCYTPARPAKLCCLGRCPTDRVLRAARSPPATRRTARPTGPDLPRRCAHPIRDQESTMSQNLFNAQQEFKYAAGKSGTLYALSAIERAGVAKLSRLPISLRIVLESALRNFDGRKITEAHIR